MTKTADKWVATDKKAQKFYMAAPDKTHVIDGRQGRNNTRYINDFRKVNSKFDEDYVNAKDTEIAVVVKAKRLMWQIIDGWAGDRELLLFSIFDKACRFNRRAVMLLRLHDEFSHVIAGRDVGFYLPSTSDQAEILQQVARHLAQQSPTRPAPTDQHSRLRASPRAANHGVGG